MTRLAFFHIQISVFSKEHKVKVSAHMHNHDKWQLRYSFIDVFVYIMNFDSTETEYWQKLHVSSIKRDRKVKIEVYFEIHYIHLSINTYLNRENYREYVYYIALIIKK